MDKPLLNDPDEFPTDEVLSQALKKCKTIWDKFFKKITDEYPDLSLQWNYYKDGKSWLCKMTKKKKTICWISIWDKFFKIAFYFTEKNNNDIQKLEIDDSLKEEFCTTKNVGKLKPLIVEVRKQAILKSVYHLIEYKSKS